MNRKKRGQLCPMVVMALFFTAVAVNAFAARERVLLLSSYHPGFPTFFQQYLGVKEAFQERDIRLDIEFMDSKRLYDRESALNFEVYFKHKLHVLPPYDLILTSDDNALRFALKHRNLFAAAPLVFFGINDLEFVQTLDAVSSVTGVVEHVSMAETIKAMQGMLPGLQEVVAVVDGTSSGQGDLKTFEALKVGFPELHLRSLSLADLTFEELGEKLSELGMTSGVLLLSAYTDVRKEVREFDDSMRFLLDNLNVPLFHLWMHGVGQGLIGGKVISQYQQALAAGDIAVRILDGESADDIAFVTDSPNRFVFDKKVLDAFSLRAGTLPEGAVMLNSPDRRLQVSRGTITGLLVVIVLLVAVVILLGLLSRRRATTLAAVRDREELFRALFQNNHAVMLLIEPETGHIVDANPAARSYYGYSETQFRRLDIFEINILSQEEVKAEIARAMSEKRNYFCFRHRLASGEVRDVEVLSGPIMVNGKSLLYSLVRDVTRRVEAECCLKDAIQAAKASSRAKGEFLANMSHEVRTPMNGILGMLQLLEGTELDDRQRELVAVALGSGKSLLHVINDILDLSRVEAGKMELNRAPFSLKTMLDGVMALFANRAEEKGIRITYDLNPDLDPVYVADEGRLRQVLLNLVGNAVKFTDQGQVDVFVQARSGPRGGLEFVVRDTGIGIPKKMQQSIFEPFTQVDSSHTRAYEGSGLGLRIVSKLVQLMGGEVQVESVPGQGSVFTFAIEAESGQMPLQVSAVQGHPSDLAAIPSRKKLRVLAVEDNRVNQATVKMMLERMGHRVDVVDNGQKALQALEEDRFDVVLMDIQMPVMDGIEALKRIRSGTDGVARPDIPVVALTAHAMKGEREKFLALGMNGYIAKPVSMKDLEEELSGLEGDRSHCP